ncbi:MAG: hypothetical protein A2W93_03195 [Bacteroidetes bacterium GWF2_43_63]|nr:MAG: hypothetical protein A2W94_09195 [Bacteroidetes bacterium GWE2_42_42]OFY53667.1 MAG: hypothetical protein A2W93_03195 [Bacteroidetes bacterium GWF2_43_63]HBG70989.1 hypothetical protein [Bacteroidales bacterium]HCB62920.1 hypothetical protein [Bacteroidales bacterium]HCY24316.1 hypothetical protein [Bacteroidales bacterium]
MKTILLSFFVLIYMLGQAQILGPEPFNGDILVHGTSAANTVWFAPDYNPPIAFSSTGGCPGGRIGYAGSWNSFWGNFVRMPQINASGLDSIKLTFDVSHSYFAAHTADWCRFYVWADGAYKKIVSAVRINGSNVLYDSGANGKGFKFTETRSCAATEVIFDLSTIVDKSSILIYLEPSCGYDNSNTFYVYFDNIAVANAGTTPFSVNCHTDSSMCIDHPAWTLNGCTPAGGTYSGNGVSGGVFNPALAGAGTHSIKYKATDGMTTDSCYFNITVHPVPVLNITVAPNDTLCSGTPLTLTASGAQTIQWSNGIQNGITFIPATQSFIVIGIDANGCQSDSAVSIVVNSQPSVILNLPYDSVCGYTMPVFPTYPLSGGLPQGGIYSGSNVSGTNLIGDIVMGNHYSVVNYTFTDSHGCYNTATDSVYIYNCDTGFPETQDLSVSIYPNPAADAVYIIHDNSINHLEIVSVDGKMVWSTSMNPESNTTIVDISALEKGTYFLRYRSNDAAGVISFVKE